MGHDGDDAAGEALAETGRATIPVLIVALLTTALGLGLVGTARRIDQRRSTTLD